MRSLLFSVVFLLLSGVIYAQTNPFVRTISKDGLKTDKDCKWVKVDSNMVVFHVSGSTYEVFDYVGTDLNGKPRWDSRSTGKQAYRVVQANGLVVFHKTDKKMFAYIK